MKLQPFKRVVLQPHFLTVQHWRGKGLSQADAENIAAEAGAAEVYQNNVFQVHVKKLPPVEALSWPAMVHLSIRRLDRKPVRDWRLLQQIKNALVGPDHEAVELYPAESRLVDTANQFHLWCLAEPGLRFPFGYVERLVTGPKDAADIGAKQRPFAEVAP